MAISLPIEFEYGDDLAVVGKANLPFEGESIVRGTYKFPNDHLAGHKLFAAIKGCPHAHCKVVSIDTSAAEALDGVKAVITYKDNPYFDTEEILVWGWEVAAVAATDPFIAERALDLIEVEYEVLPFIIDPNESMEPGAPLVGTFPDGNVTANASRNTRGDIEAGFAEADVTIEIEHDFLNSHTQNTLEPCSGIAWWEGDHVYGYDQNQNPHSFMRTYASELGVPQSHVHIRATSGAGGYGGGGQTNECTLCGILSKMTGMPVASHRTRRLQTIRRRNHYSPKGWVKMGCKNDGTMTAMHIKWYSRGGFNAARGNGWEDVDCTYILDNVEQETYGVATNTGFGAGYR